MSTTVQTSRGRGQQPPPPPPAPPTPSPGGALRRSADWARRAPLLPALIFTIVVTQLPFLGTLVISFMDWNAYYPDERGFTGFSNYADVLTDVNMRQAIIVTIELTVVVVLVSLVLGMLIALLLDRKFLGRGAVRTMMITPFLVVPVAAALMWKHALFNPEYGLLNGMLTWIWGLFGSDNPPQPDWSWQIFRYMTFPHLRRYLELGALLGAIYIVQTFDAVFVITSGGLGTANLPYIIYQTFYTAHDYGLASAAGVITVIGTILIATLALRTVSTLFQEENAR
jgi:sorbitol/mannitol transport system permease protein